VSVAACELAPVPSTCPGCRRSVGWASPKARSRWFWHQRVPAGVSDDGAGVAWAKPSKSPFALGCPWRGMDGACAATVAWTEPSKAQGRMRVVCAKAIARLVDEPSEGLSNVSMRLQGTRPVFSDLPSVEEEHCPSLRALVAVPDSSRHCTASQSRGRSVPESAAWEYSFQNGV